MRTQNDICIIMNENCYSGREYAHALQEKNIFIDLIIIGNNDSFDEDESERCGGLWNPCPQQNLSNEFPIYHFKSLNDNSLISHLRESDYKIGIQGGTGILKKLHLDEFLEGIINFHPGDLPSYRGCSAPEYQYADAKPIISTCHFISEGIDDGDIIEKFKLDVNLTNYHTFRASIYPLTAKFVADIIHRWLSGEKFKRTKQNEKLAVYRKYIGKSKINDLIKNWTNYHL